MDPNAIIAQVVINEFLTATLAPGGLLDEDGELQDWIELYNTGTNAMNLAGWSLTDEAGEPAKWTFPSVTLGGGQYLVVFASAKDRKVTTPGAKLHTNFKMNSAGDYVALFNAESPRQAMTEFRPEFPEQRNDYSYGLDNAKLWRAFPHDDARPCQWQQHDLRRGATSAFQCAARLFRQPVPTHAQLRAERGHDSLHRGWQRTGRAVGLGLHGAVAVANTTIFRAAAFQTGFLPSTIETHTYIFPGASDSSAGPAAGRSHQLDFA